MTDPEQLIEDWREDAEDIEINHAAASPWAEGFMDALERCADQLEDAMEDDE